MIMSVGECLIGTRTHFDKIFSTGTVTTVFERDSFFTLNIKGVQTLYF